MTRCTFSRGQWNCGSYQFNLYKDDIDQGDLCDVHYWQDQAQGARADEREACAKVCDDNADIEHWQDETSGGIRTGLHAKLIRARGQE